MISKLLIVLNLWIVICATSLACGYAESYSLSDFVDSGLFPNQFGNTGYRESDGTEVFARIPGSYNEINKAFPGAIEFSYPQAVELRKLVFRREITDQKRNPENSELLYSYWRVNTGVFCVIWREAYMADGSDYVAGRSFFVSLDEKEKDSPNKKSVQTLSATNNFMFSLESIHFPNMVNWFTGKYSRLVCGRFTDDGLSLKCYLIKSDGSIVMDITWLYGWKLKVFEDYFDIHASCN